MKKFMLLILALVIAGLAFAQTDITIGTGTSTGRYPLNDYYVYSRSQCIYLESEIGAPGTIHKLRWFRNDTGANPSAIGTTQIWLKTVSNAVMTDIAWEDPGTMVAEISNIDLGAGNGWYEIDITDFAYAGGNLLVSVYTQNAPFTTPHSDWRYTATTGFNRCRLGNSDTVNPPTLSLSTSRPNIQINMTAGAPTVAPNPAILAAPMNGEYALLGDVLSWNSGGGFPATYDVYLDTVDGSTLVSDNQAGLTYTPTLAPGTTYYWKVVPANAFGDAVGCPVWSFMTPSATQLVESFENTTFPPAGWANPGSWSRSTSTYNHGVASAYKYPYDSALYIISTPKVTINATSTLSFMSYCSTTSASAVWDVVYSPDRTSWTQVPGSSFTHPTASTWVQRSIDLSSLAGNNYYLGIRAGGYSYASYYFDKVIGPAITPEAPGAPTLSAPADLATNVNEYTNFTWTAPVTGGVPTGYKLYVDTVNPPVAQVADLNALTYTLTTPLAYNTTYYWSVAAYNGAGTSAQPTARSFTTRANPIVSAFPYVVNFDDLTTPALPLNWIASEAVAGASQHWKTTTTAPHGASAPHSAPNYAYLYCYLASTTYNPYYLTTPPISLGADAKRLTYWYWIGDDTVEEPLSVEISTDLANWTNLYTHSNTTNTLDWYQQIVSLSDYTNQTVYLRFSGVSNYGSGMTDLGLDDIVVETIPAAPIFSYAPTAIDFGTVMQGVQTAPQAITITNIGGGELSVNPGDISITGPNADAFTLNTSNLPALLIGGQSTGIYVSLNANVEGPISATITIMNDGNSYEVALTANALPAGIVVIGNGTANNNLPINPYFGYTYSQSIFLQSEINVPNQRIESVYYYWNGVAEAVDSNDWTIYMGHTAATEFASTTDWIPLANLSTVFTGTVALPATAGWIEIPLTAPFIYNNTDNLVIAVDENAPSYDGSSEFFYSTAAATNRSLRYYSDSTNPDPAAPVEGTLVLAYPNVMLQLGDIPLGPPLPVVMGSPADEAVGQLAAGFNFTWAPDPLSGPIDYYAFFLSTDDQDLYGQFYGETTGNSFNPVGQPYGDGTFAFDYSTRYYWQVIAYQGTEEAASDVRWFEIEDDPHVTIPYAQDFGTDTTWPTNWIQTSTGSNVWTVSTTNNAGGTASEMKATWVSLNGTTRLITPPISTTGVANLTVSFNTLYDDYGLGVTAKIQYSHDLSTWYDTPWSVVSGGGNVSGLQTALITGLVDQPTTYVAWTLDGNHFQYDSWYVDDVAISMPPDHDVAVVSYDTITEVVPENTLVTPMATVMNNGINTETFDVTCTIGTYTSTVTVTGLGTGATQQVSFAPLTPELWTANAVAIEAILATDEVPANNTKSGALICIDLDKTGLANNAQTDQFVQFNLNDPTTLYPLATPYSGTYFVSGADWMNGNWMGVNYDDGTLATDEFYNINPVTGAYLPAIGETGAALMGMAWDDTNDVMYGVGADNLYTVDPTTGLATLGGTLWYNLEGTPTNFVDIGGLMIAAAYDNTNNILYGIDLGNDALWTINPATYELTLNGFFGVDLNYAQDAAFDQDGGQLYLAAYSTFGGLYWVDTTSGGAYLVAPFGGANAYELDGFAIPYGLAPETPVVSIAGEGTLTWTPVLGAVSYNVYSSDDPYGTFTLEANVLGTEYTGLAAAKKFYKVAAVGGRQSTNHQELRVNTLLRKTGRLGVEKRNNTGIAR